MAALSGARVISRLFPRVFDNAYRGRWLAVWLLVPLVALKLTIGFNSMVFTRFVATGPDAIPVDRFGDLGGATVLNLFALLGLWGFLLALQATLALVRYRAMIPFTYLLILLQQVGGRVVAATHPVVSAGDPSSHSVSIMVAATWAVTLAGLALSLLDRPQTEKARAA